HRRPAREGEPAAQRPPRRLPGRRAPAGRGAGRRARRGRRVRPYPARRMRELTLTANGLRVRCLADGPDDGSLVLLLHGFPEGAASWSALLPALAAAGHLAVAPDLRGYGGTDCPEGED